MAAADTARLLASLGLDNSHFLRGMKGALGATGKLDKGLGKVGGSTKKLAGGLGKAAIVGVGAVAAGLGASAKAAIDWQDAFQGVVKTVDITSKKGNPLHLTFDQISDSLRKMSTEMPIAATDLAAIAEAGGQMGVGAKDIESFTRQVAILATTTNVSADDAATALGQLQNIIGLTGDEFDNFAASLVELGNKGSSTESQILEIARRAGGAAKLFGIAKEQTLGWAAAAANLGFNQEAAGTALQKVFVTLLPKFQKGNKTLQDVTGKTAAVLKKSFTKAPGAALVDLIKSIGKLKGAARTDAIQKLFGKGGNTLRLVNGLADSLKTNLIPALDDANRSWFEGKAAQDEFNKRNATVASAFKRLKGGIIDAAVSIGEGMVPALGRAADKLSAFLKLPENRNALKDIGKNIGQALDKIDWDKLLNAAKGVSKAFQPALDLVTKIAGLIASLPPGVIGAGAGLVITDKVTGGAISSGIGGIIGGLASSLAKSLAAQIPVFGKAFVQPVFVTNLGPGGLPGGVPGGGGGGGGGGAGAKVGGTAGAGVFIADLPEHNKIVADVVARNFKVDDPTFLNHLQNKDQDTPWDKILQALGLKQPSKPATDAKLDDLKNAVNTSPKALAAKVEAAKQAQVDAIRNTGSTTGISIRGTTGAVQTAQGAITAAIAASRPIVTTNVDVNVSATTVEKSTTTSTRYGGGNGSYGGRGVNNDHGKG